MTTRPVYDVAIVGASIAGCTAAILFASQGLRVALIERHADLDAYKVLCTHFIQPNATPTIQRLGIAAALEAAGAVRNGLQPTQSSGCSSRRRRRMRSWRNMPAGSPPA